MSARIWTRSFASRFESGSSIRKTLGTRMIARPIATRCRCPPDSCPGLRSRNSSSPSSVATSRTRASRSRFAHLRDLQREADVLRDGQVRVERVVLEHHRDVALLRRQEGDVALADQDRARVDLLEPGEHAQRGRLPGAGRTDEHHELAVRDVQVERVDRRRVRAGVDPRRLDEADVSHRPGSSSDVTRPTASASSCRSRACASCGRAERVEPEQRRTDDRRRHRRADGDRRADLAEAVADPATSAPSARLEQAAAEQHLDRLSLEAEPRQRDACERDHLADEALDDRRRLGIRIGLARARAARARSRGAGRSGRGGSPPRARSASRGRSGPGRSARGSSARRGRPRCVRRRTRRRGRRRSRRPSRP